MLYSQLVQNAAQKEITSQTDHYVVSLFSKTYVFEDKVSKY